MNRTCHRCGRRYYRCQQMRVWPVRNPGHRDGWGTKAIVSFCLDCQSPETTDRLLFVAQVTITKGGTIRKLPARITAPPSVVRVVASKTPTPKTPKATTA